MRPAPPTATVQVSIVEQTVATVRISLDEQTATNSLFAGLDNMVGSNRLPADLDNMMDWEKYSQEQHDRMVDKLEDEATKTFDKG